MEIRDYRIQNDRIAVVVSEIGAQMQSITAGRTEFLWQGDSKYWKDRATNLFPYIGRLTDGKYIYKGKSYEMEIHGFAKVKKFQVINKSESHIEFSIKEDPSTLVQYPFRFEYRVSYRLVKNSIEIQFNVINNSDDIMYFAVGGHPGFNVPNEEGLTFEDYEIRFEQNSLPDRIVQTSDYFLSGDLVRYPLEDDKRFKLTHDLFDDDAIILQNIATTVSILSRKGKRKVSVEYPYMKYVGIWHRPHSDAPFVCIEPWSSLPSRQDIIEDIEFKSDLNRLEPGKEYTNKWSITIE